MQDRETKVFVGGAASGLITLAYFLQAHASLPNAKPARVVVFDPEGLNKGMAYRLPDAGLSLNQPAGDDMNPFLKGGPGLPSSYLDWLAKAHPQKGYTSSCFTARGVYGDYLSHVRDWVHEKAAQLGVELREEKTKVTSITPMGKGYTVTADNWTPIHADQVVLAMGHGWVPKIEHPLYVPAYVHKDFGSRLGKIASTARQVTMIGAGASAFDVIGALDAKGYRGTYTTLSLSGNNSWIYNPAALEPQGAQAKKLKVLATSYARDDFTVHNPSASLKNYIRTANNAGIATQFLLGALLHDDAGVPAGPVRDTVKATYGNPVSPQRHELIQGLVAAGRLHFDIGRVDTVTPVTDTRLELSVRDPANAITRRVIDHPLLDNAVMLRGAAVGPNGSHHPLIKQMVADKVLRINTSGALDTQPAANMYVVGPIGNADKNGIGTFTPGYAAAGRALAQQAKAIPLLTNAL